MTARDVNDPVSLEGFNPVYHDEKGNRYRVDAPNIIYGNMIADMRTTPDQGQKSFDELTQIAESFMRELYEVPNDAELVEYGSGDTRIDFHLYVRENGFWRDTYYEISVRTDGLIVCWSKYVIPDDSRIPEFDPSLLDGLTREKLEDLMKKALIIDYRAGENTIDDFEYVDAIVFYHAPKEQYAVSIIAHDKRNGKNVRCGAYLLADEKLIPYYASSSDD